MRYKTKQMDYGFTLIELSIVLVIIALIAGGVIGGRSLVEASKIQSLASQIASYKTALNTFILQYDALPGDMNDAWEYWGTDCEANATLCNGNGNNRIEPNGDWISFEGASFFQMLSLAEILPSDLTGTVAGTNGMSSIGTNIPETAFKGVGVEPAYGIWAGTNTSFGKIGNNFALGGEDSAGYLTRDVFTPQQAKKIDSKMDDGRADGGYVRPGWFTSVLCSDNVITDSSGNYLVSNTGSECRLHVFWD